MATYKGIQGYSVQSLSSDPTAASGSEGQFWYNSSTGKFKITVAAAGSWAAGGNFLTAGTRSSASSGTQTAGLYSTGVQIGVPADTGPSTEYDGSTWTEVNNVNTPRTYAGGAGRQTAGLIFGGASPPNFTLIGGLTEAYDGTSWTTVNPLNNSRYYVGSTNYAPAGACLVLGGTPTPYDYVEEYDGTSWTEIADINTGRYALGGAGTTTSAMAFAGIPPAGSVNDGLSESFNGTSWSETADLNTGRDKCGAAGESNTSALCYAGSPGYTGKTEKWDGSSWTEVGDLTNPRMALSAIGTASLALGGGGYYTPGGGVATEEWTDPVYTIKTATVS